MSATRYRREIDRNDRFLSFALFAEYNALRYPFLHEGETLDKRNEVRAHLKKRGYQISQVSIDFNEYLGMTALRCSKQGGENSSHFMAPRNPGRGSQRELSRSTDAVAIAIRQIHAHITLFPPSSSILRFGPDPQRSGSASGVRFVSLTEAMGDPAIAEDPGSWEEADFLNQ